MATLNSKLAIFAFSCDQIYYWQLPEPTPRPTPVRLAFSVRGYPQELLGSSQGLLRYPGVFGILDDVGGRNRTVGQHVAQELYGFATSIGMFLVLGRGQQVFGGYIGDPEPGDPHSAALSFFERKHQALRLHRQVVLRGSQHAPIIVLGVLAHYERHARRPDDADGPS